MDVLIFSINKIVIPTLSTGSIYALGAIGITLIFSILRFAHFAHGDIMTLGGFIGYGLTIMLPGVGLYVGLPTAFVLLPIAAIITAIICYIIDKLIYQPLRNRSVKPVILLMSSIGVALMIQGLLRMFVGVQSRSIFIDDRKDIFRIKFPDDIASSKLVFSEPQYLLVVTLIVSVICLQLFLNKTRIGKGMRAMADNPVLAKISGIPQQTVIRWTWLIGGWLAASAGILLALDVSLKPDLSFNLLFPLFAAAILGGVGHPVGAVIGAFIVALTENLAVFNWSVILRPIASYASENYLESVWEVPNVIILIPSEYKVVIPFVLLVALLIWRPTGIMKGSVL